MATSELVFKTAEELGSLLNTREVSPVEIVKQCLDRIDALNPKVNAFITVTRTEALKRARQAEAEIRNGLYRGPLHGIPYAAKDIVATKGIRTTNGSRLTARWVPDYDSAVTTRLDSAGAILLGKLNCLEFAMGVDALSLFGPTRNPWALDHSPAGSSSGSGAAVAARMVPLAIGTDTGGSIRKPANVCGIVGVKQTYGLVSKFGVTPVSWSCDHVGPMTRSVADAAIMLQAMAGHDPKDATTARRNIPNYRAELRQGVKGLRIGVPVNYFFDELQPEVSEAARTAITKLEELGASIVNVRVPHIELAGPALWMILNSEAACFHKKHLEEQADLFQRPVREGLELAKLFTATDYVQAMRARTMLVEGMRQVFDLCDVMALPAGNPAVKIQSREEALAHHKSGTQTESWSLGNITGIPAIVVPCGFVAGPPVLPMGIQFYGRPFRESTLFRVAHAYESATEWHLRRPLLDDRG